MKYRLTVAVTFACLSGLAQAGLFGPSNYDDCVLEGVKNAKTDAAVSAVISACTNKFPPPLDLPKLKAGKNVTLSCKVKRASGAYIEYVVRGNQISWKSNKGQIIKRTANELVAKIRWQDEKTEVTDVITINFNTGDGDINGGPLFLKCEESD